MGVVYNNMKSLAIKDPDLAKQWHPTKNGFLTPNDVTMGSGKKIWWCCKKGHEWKTTISNRKNGKGCPYCSGKYACADNSLGALKPELSSQWHPSKNGELTPNNVTTGSGRKVWWRCEKGHEWQAYISNRVKGNGCPYCTGKRACIDNCLQTIHPELSSQWHPSKNGELTPSNVTFGSQKRAWWICERGHEWEASVKDRTSGRGCPDCNRESQTSFPEQAIYFYLKKIFNDTLNRYKHNNKWEIDIFVPSLKFGIEYDGIYYHKDNANSDFLKEKSISNDGISLLRVKETNKKRMNYNHKDRTIYCNQCHSGNQLDDVIKLCIDYISKNITFKPYNISIDVRKDRTKIYDSYIKSEKKESFLIKYPELAKQWYHKKNLNVKPEMLKSNSNKRVWWQCEKGHTWQASVCARSSGSGCPYCSGKRACVDNCLQTLNPKLSKQLHPTKNGNLKPKDVTSGSGKKVWWKCGKGHEWKATISSRMAGHCCPYCSGQRVCDDNSLNTINPELSKQWHPTKNGALTPNDVTVGTKKKAWWICKKGHEWKAAINNRTAGRGCPYCTGKRVSTDNCLQTLNPKLSKQWHPNKNGNLTPKDVTSGSGKKVWLKCGKGHEWKAAINDRNQGKGCPFCSGNSVCEDNCLHTLNPKLSKQWHPNKNGNLTPKDVTSGSGKKVWWKCEKGHEWKATISSRMAGCSCPYCSGKRVEK